MTDIPTLHGAAKVDKESPFIRFLRATEIDARLLGMIAALILIWVGFHFYGHFVNGFGACDLLALYMPKSPGKKRSVVMVRIMTVYVCSD